MKQNLLIKITFFVLIVFALAYLTSFKKETTYEYSGWSTYAGAKDGNRYSSNEQINVSNVTDLKIAWTYSSKDKNANNRSQNQCNPIIINGILYGVS